MQQKASVLRFDLFFVLLFALCAGNVSASNILLLDREYRPACTIGVREVRSISALPDGSLYILGDFSLVNGVPRGGLVRLDPNGQLDPQFQPGRNVGIYVPGAVFTVQRDGKIILAADGAKRILRLNQDGTIDKGFSEASFWGLNGYTSIYTIVQLPDGKILIGGDFYGRRYGLERLMPNGVLDPTFIGGRESKFWDLGAVRRIALQRDGKLVLGLHEWGSIFQSNTNRLVRLLPDGSLDDIFTPAYLDSFSSITGVVVQEDDKIVIAGSFTSLNGQSYTNLARLDPDGSLDHDFNGNQPASDIVQLGNGELKVFAEIQVGTLRNPRSRYISKRLDHDGKILHETDLNAFAPAIRDGPLLAADGIIYVVASRANQTGNVISDLLRFTTNDLPKEDYAVLLESTAKAELLAIPESDQLFIKGDFDRVNGFPRKLAARLNRDGTLDQSFNAELGVALANTFSIYPIVAQPDGRLIASELILPVPGVSSELYLIRLNPDGTRDSNFKRSKIVFSENPQIAQSPWIESGCVDTNGRIYITGGFQQLAGLTRRGVARLLPDGSVDRAFRSAVEPNEGEPTPVYQIIGVDNEQMVWLKQRLAYNSTRNIDTAIFRLHADGSKDNTFQPTGSFLDYYFSAASAGDGKVIIAGPASIPSKTDPLEVFRLNRDGSIDETFPYWVGSNRARYAVLQGTQGTWVISRLRFDSVETDPRFVREYPLELFVLDPSGGLLTAGRVSVRDPWSTSVLPSGPGVLLIAGAFTSANGEPRASLARVQSRPPIIPPLLSLRIAAGIPSLGSEFSTGLPWRIDQSHDLISWAPFTNYPALNSPSEVKLPLSDKRFFRAVVP